MPELQQEEKTEGKKKAKRGRRGCGEREGEEQVAKKKRKKRRRGRRVEKEEKGWGSRRGGGGEEKLDTGKIVCLGGNAQVLYHNVDECRMFLIPVPPAPEGILSS